MTLLSSPLALCNRFEVSLYTFTQIFPIQKSKNSQGEKSSKKEKKRREMKAGEGKWRCVCCNSDHQISYRNSKTVTEFLKSKN